MSDLAGIFFIFVFLLVTPAVADPLIGSQESVRKIDLSRPPYIDDRLSLRQMTIWRLGNELFHNTNRPVGDCRVVSVIAKAYLPKTEEESDDPGKVNDSITFKLLVSVVDGNYDSFAIEINSDMDGNFDAFQNTEFFSLGGSYEFAATLASESSYFFYFDPESGLLTYLSIKLNGEPILNCQAS